MVNASRRNEQIWMAVGSLMILATVALAFGLVYTMSIMIPFVLAVFLTTAVSPIVDFQVLRCKIPSPIAIFLALILVVVFLAVLVLLLTISVQAIIATAGDYSDNFGALMTNMLERLKKLHINDLDEAKIGNDLKQQLPMLITQAAGTGTALLTNFFLIVLFVIFLMAGRNPHRLETGVYLKIESAVRRYILTKFTISFVTALLVWIILMIFGLRMAFVFALLTFLLNFIPNIGSVIATLLPLPLAVAQFDSIWAIVAVVAIPGALQIIIGNAIEPKLMGRGLELHPVTVLLALAFWGLLWGYLGMVLAVPITAVLRIVLMQFETTQPIGNLLGGQLPG